MPQHNFAILYVEDETTDILFLKRAFAAAGITNPLKVANDGRQAINYLAGNEPFSDRQQSPLPSLVLLDINLPNQTGFEVLQWIRAHPKLRLTIVIVYTSSGQRRDLETAYALGANAYLVKQGNPGELIQMIKAFRDFWLVHNEPPH